MFADKGSIFLPVYCDELVLTLGQLLVDTTLLQTIADKGSISLPVYCDELILTLG